MYIFKHFNKANVHVFYIGLPFMNLSKGNSQSWQKWMVKSICQSIIFKSEEMENISLL